MHEPEEPDDGTHRPQVKATIVEVGEYCFDTFQDYTIDFSGHLRRIHFAVGS